MKKLLSLLLVPALLSGIFTPAFASSHREGPFITERPAADGTDLYMFRSYEPGREDFVTIIANYIPLQYAGGGPNYFALGRNTVYEIQIDNNHDAKEDITFRFTGETTLKGLTVDAGGQQVEVPLVNIGQIGPGVNDTANSNVIQTVDMGLVRGESVGTRGKRRGRLTRATSLVDNMAKPVDNIGNKSIPNYATYASNHGQTFTLDGCDSPLASQSRVWAGQRREAFYLNLGETFDLVNFADPVADVAGDESKELNTFGDFNVTTFAVEVPVACLTSGDEPVIAAWTRSLVPATVTQLRDAQIPAFDAITRVFRKLGGIRSDEFRRAERVRGNRYVQVSRLGLPLVNEVVIGVTDKDKFNASEPQDDAQFAQYVTNPTFPKLLEILFPGVLTAPTTPRNDLVATFLTGNAGLNKPAGDDNAVYEALRLNTSIAPTAESAQNRLGFAAGDLAGFPNGRRPKDDVVDVVLRVANGLLLTLDPATAELAPSGTVPLTDGATENSQTLSNNGPLAFLSGFPYLPHPIAGSPSN